MDFGTISMRFTHVLSRESMVTNTLFESNLYQQSNEINITLLEKYLNYQKLYFKLGLNMPSFQSEYIDY